MSCLLSSEVCWASKILNMLLLGLRDLDPREPASCLVLAKMTTLAAAAADVARGREHERQRRPTVNNVDTSSATCSLVGPIELGGDDDDDGDGNDRRAGPSWRLNFNESPETTTSDNTRRPQTRPHSAWGPAGACVPRPR